MTAPCIPKSPPATPVLFWRRKSARVNTQTEHSKNYKPLHSNQDYAIKKRKTDDVVDSYNLSSTSVYMAGDPKFDGHGCHPSKVYGSRDIRVATTKSSLVVPPTKGCCHKHAIHSNTTTITSKSNVGCSVSFDEKVRGRLIPSIASAVPHVGYLWYQKEDYDEFRFAVEQRMSHILTSSRSSTQQLKCPIGMEKWMYRHQTQTLRVQATGCVLMEQFCQRQRQMFCTNQSCLPEQRIAALYRLTSSQAQAMACQRAQNLLDSISNDSMDQYDDDEDSEENWYNTSTASLGLPIQSHHHYYPDPPRKEGRENKKDI